MTDMRLAQQYIDHIHRLGGTLPEGFHDDQWPMQIAKLSDALHKIMGRNK